MLRLVALLFTLALLLSPGTAFLPPSHVCRAGTVLFAKKKAGQKQAELLRKMEEAKRKQASSGADAAAGAAAPGPPAEPPKANKDWRGSVTTSMAATATPEADYDEMEALLGQVDGMTSDDFADAASELSGEIDPTESWKELLDPAGAPVSWLDVIVRGGPIYVVADPRGGAAFAAVVRDLNAKVSSTFPGSVVAVSVDPFNDLRKVAKKGKVDLGKIMLLSDPTKTWLMAHKCVGPQVTRLTTKLFVIDIKAGGGVVREVVVLDDPLAVADSVIRKIQS